MKNIIIACWMLLGNILHLGAQTYDVAYTTELQYNLSRKVNWCNLLRLDVCMPIAKNGTFELSSIQIYKTNPERIVNDLQTFSNIEEDNLPFAIAILGYTHHIGNTALFLGIRNLNEDYFTAPGMSLFTNSSCGIFPTLSVNYPIANYPLSALCLDYKATLGKFGIKSSLYNGKGYNGWNNGNHPFTINPRRDGIFSITEINYQTEYGKYFSGFSLHTNSDMPDVAEEQNTWKTEKKASPKMTTTWWGYVERRMWSTDNQEINLLAQYSRNSSAISECRSYMGAGATWILDALGQKRHETGLILSAAQFKSGYEIAGEITCRYSFNKNMSVQPAAHLIKNCMGFHKVFMIRFSCRLNMRRAG